MSSQSVSPMKLKPKISIAEHFETVEAPKIERSKEHLLIITMVESVRQCEEQTSQEVRYYISSLAPDAKQLAQSIRTHWTIENPLHWVLDVAFREDECRIRTGHAPENFTIMRHLALSALNQEKTAKVEVKNKRLRAGWDDDYLLKVLAG